MREPEQAVQESEIERVDRLNSEAFANLYRNVDQALAMAREANQIALGIDHRRGLAKSYQTLGACHGMRADYPKATRFFRKALTIYEQLGADRGIAESLNNMAIVCSSTGDYPKALAYLDRCIPYLEKLGDAEAHGRCHYSIGMVHGSTGNYAAAFESFERALAIFEGIDNKHGLANTLLGMGVLYDELGSHATALDYGQRSLAIKEELGDLFGVGNALSNIGVIYARLKNYQEALVYQRRALAARGENANRKNLAGTLINLGYLYRQTGEYENALDYYMRGVAMCEEIGERHNYSTGLAGVAEVHRLAGRMEEAYRWIEHALRIKEEIGDKPGMVATLLLLGGIELQEGRIEESTRALDRALALAEEIGSRLLQSEAHEAFAELFQATGDHRSALESFKRFHEATQELHRQETEKRLENLRLVHEIEQARTEAEMYRIRSEEMQRSMELQEKHLTSMAMTLVRQNEFLLSIRSQIVSIADKSGAARPMLRRVAGEIKAQANSSEGWSAFEEQFEKLHSDFMRRLSERHGALSPTELKVCALLRLNLASKEIANILCVTVRCAETHRYNIRKKLQLPPKTNLSTFFTNY